MNFSKSFGYAVRSILFLALLKEERKRVQLDEIAETLNIPRYFLGKVLNKLVKEGIIDAVKGHKGGFSINEKTLSTTLAILTPLTGDTIAPGQCALHLGVCNPSNPCPVHYQLEPLKSKWNALLNMITLRDLLTGTKEELIPFTKNK